MPAAEAFGNALVMNWAALVVRALYQGSLAILFVWGIVRLFPRLHPAVRCWLWRLAYLKLMIAFLWAKPIELYLQYGFKELLSQWVSIPGFHFPLHQTALDHSILGSTPLSLVISPATHYLFCLWIVCVCVFLTIHISGWRKQRLLQTAIRPIDYPVLIRVYQELARQCGLRKPPALFISDWIRSPLLHGPTKPKIILPAPVVETYSIEEIRLILAHELAHYQRGDLHWIWLPTMARIVFFFHPLVWVTQNEWILAHEICCDDRALRLSQAPQSDYGRLLLRASFGPILDSFNPGATFVGSDTKLALKKRLQALKYTPSRHSGTAMFAGLIFLALGIVSLVPWRLAEAKSLPVNLWINYLTLEKRFEIAAHVILPPQDIKKMSLLIDDQSLKTKHTATNLCFGYAEPTEKSYPKMGPHKVTLEVHTKKGMVKEQNWVYFQNSMNWSNRYLGVHNDKTVLKLGPFIYVISNSSIRHNN